MRIVVDIDGVLTLETEGFDYAKRTPNLKTVAHLLKWKGQGHKIILHSSRWVEDEEVTRAWLEKNGIPFDKLVLGKPYGDAYLDDKSCREVEEVEKLWEK